MDKCNRRFSAQRKANIWETPAVFHWRSDYIKSKANCVTVVRKHAGKKMEEKRREGMKFREHVAHMCLPAPASTCMDLHTERHMKDVAAQTNNGQMSHWMREAAVRESQGRNQTPI